MSLTSRITSPSGPNEELFAAAPKCAGLPRVQPRPVRVGAQVVGPAITQERPGEELLRIVRIGDVNDRHGAADASKALADVVRHAVLGPATHVARAAGHSDAGRQDRVGAVFGQVINGEIRPVALRRARGACAPGSPSDSHAGSAPRECRPGTRSAVDSWGPRHRSPRRRGAAAEDHFPLHSRRSDRCTPVRPAKRLPRPRNWPTSSRLQL